MIDTIDNNLLLLVTLESIKLRLLFTLTEDCDKIRHLLNIDYRIYQKSIYFLLVMELFL